MKTPEEWADLLISNQIAIIKEIQKEAYNQAISDSAKLADDLFPECDSYSILKLKR